MRRLFSFRVIYTYIFFIVFISVIPVNIRHSLRFPLDKVIHFFVYLIFSFLLSNTLALNRQKYSRLKGFLYTFGIGLAMEALQYFLPYRSFEVFDVFSNTLGALLGTFMRIRL